MSYGLSSTQKPKCLCGSVKSRECLCGQAMCYTHSFKCEEPTCKHKNDRLCYNHVLTCSISNCKISLCKNHQCSSCMKLVCSKHYCFICKEATCTNHKSCISCTSNVEFNQLQKQLLNEEMKHKKKSNRYNYYDESDDEYDMQKRTQSTSTSNIVCTKCSKKCSKCYLTTCKLHQYTCKQCNRQFCRTHVDNATTSYGTDLQKSTAKSERYLQKQPNYFICADDIIKCTFCGSSGCKNQDFITCNYCTNGICNNHQIQCDNCSQTLCSIHLIPCQLNCGKYICASAICLLLHQQNCTNKTTKTVNDNLTINVITPYNQTSNNTTIPTKAFYNNMGSTATPAVNNLTSSNKASANNKKANQHSNDDDDWDSDSDEDEIDNNLDNNVGNGNNRSAPSATANATEDTAKQNVNTPKGDGSNAVEQQNADITTNKPAVAPTLPSVEHNPTPKPVKATRTAKKKIIKKVPTKNQKNGATKPTKKAKKVPTKTKSKTKSPSTRTRPTSSSKATTKSKLTLTPLVEEDDDGVDLFSMKDGSAATTNVLSIAPESTISLFDKGGSFSEPLKPHENGQTTTTLSSLFSDNNSPIAATTLIEEEEEIASEIVKTSNSATPTLISGNADASNNQIEVVADGLFDDEADDSASSANLNSDVAVRTESNTNSTGLFSDDLFGASTESSGGLFGDDTTFSSNNTSTTSAGDLFADDTTFSSNHSNNNTSTKTGVDLFSESYTTSSSSLFGNDSNLFT